MRYVVKHGCCAGSTTRRFGTERLDWPRSVSFGLSGAVFPPACFTQDTRPEAIPGAGRHRMCFSVISPNNPRPDLALTHNQPNLASVPWARVSSQQWLKHDPASEVPHGGVTGPSCCTDLVNSSTIHCQRLNKQHQCVAFTCQITRKGNALVVRFSNSLLSTLTSQKRSITPSACVRPK